MNIHPPVMNVHQLKRLARHLHPNEPRKRIRFVLRAWFYADIMKPWLEYLSNQSQLEPILIAHPWLIERIHRPFLKATLTRQQRLQALIEHYQVCVKIGWIPLFYHLAQNNIEIAKWQGKKNTYQLQIAYTSRFGKEGEWTLHLYENQTRLYTVAFSFQQPENPYLFIGCLQGPTGAVSKNLVRQTTRDLHDWRPRDLMLETIRQIAVQAKLQHIGLVRTQDHVYRHARSRFKKRNTDTAWSFDYDLWAKEQNAVSNQDYWILPVQTHHRTIESLPSKKRAAARRREALRIAIDEQIATKIHQYAHDR